MTVDPASGNPTGNMASFESLPCELTVAILEYTFDDPVAIAIYPLVCKQWRQIATSVLRTGTAFDNKRVASDAAGAGHVGVLEWLCTLGRHVSHKWHLYAARHGQIGVIEWLRAQECDYHEDVCAEAAASGQLATLQWLHANGAPDANVSLAAAMHGHLHVFRYAHESRGQLCPQAAEAAAAEGHVNIIEYILSTGHDIDFDTCAISALANSRQTLASLLWARVELASNETAREY